MAADVLRRCPGCDGLVTATSVYKTPDHLVAKGVRPIGFTWQHRNPLDDMDCPMVEEGAVEPHPDAPKLSGGQFGQVINVDFKNKKRLD